MRTFVAYATSDRLREVKNKRKLQTIISKSCRCRKREVPTMVIWEIFVFWKTGSSREVVTYEMWSQGEVRRYMNFIFECGIFFLLYRQFDHSPFFVNCLHKQLLCMYMAQCPHVGHFELL